LTSCSEISIAYSSEKGAALSERRGLQSCWEVWLAGATAV